MKFGYIKMLFSTFIIFMCTIILTSCSSDSFGGTLNIQAKRISLEVYAEFDEDERLESCSPYVNLYTIDDDGSTTYSDQETLTFSDDYSSTDSVTFDGLTENTDYVLKLFVTYDSKSYEVYSVNTATTPTGSTVDNPILVSTYDELLDIADDNEAYYKLSNDIDCSGNTIDSLFNSSNIFKGGFDGDSHTISNFVLPSNAYLGLFGYTEGATIKNLNLDTVSLVSSLSTSGRGETYCGALVGKGINTTIDNVNVKNVDFDITFYNSAVVSLGGFAGRLEKCSVSNSSLENASINVIKAQKQVITGLFVGVISSKTSITNSYSTGEITSVTYFRTDDNVYSYVGGFIGASGSSSGEVSDCYTIVDINVSENTSQTACIDGHSLAVGGFVGSNFQQVFNFKNCAAIADITVKTEHSGVANIGGLVGNVNMSGSKFVNSIYVAKDKGMVINYTEDGDSSSEDDEDSDSDVEIYVSLAFGTNSSFNTENIYVSSESLSYNTKTDTLISGNYVLYSDDVKDNLSTVILTAIDSYINK